jgi:hypothetical protein
MSTIFKSKKEKLQILLVRETFIKETVSSVMHVMNAINYLLGPRDTETGHRDLVMQAYLQN